MLKKSLFILGFTFAYVAAFAQPCMDSISDFCTPPVTKFSYSQHEASQMFYFQSGESKTIEIDFFEGKDYRITVCGVSEFQDLFRIVLYDTEGQIQYDNSSHNYQLHLEFSMQSNTKLQLEISAPEISDPNLKAKGCVGVLIQEMNSIKIGFQE